MVATLLSGLYSLTRGGGTKRFFDLTSDHIKMTLTATGTIMSNGLHNPADSQLKHFHGYAKTPLSNQSGLYRASTWCLITLTDLVDRSVSMMFRHTGHIY